MVSSNFFIIIGGRPKFQNRMPLMLSVPKSESNMENLFIPFMFSNIVGENLYSDLFNKFENYLTS